MTVFNGVSEFNIELTELSICVCAIEKRNAGMNVPNNAVKAMYFHFSPGIFGNVRKPIIKRKVAAKTIRNDPSWNGVRPTSPRFIKMNELPQITDNARKMTQLINRYLAPVVVDTYRKLINCKKVEK